MGSSYDVSLYERNWLDRNRLARYTDATPFLTRNLGEGYARRYKEKYNVDIDPGNSNSFLFAVSLFNSVPWSLKNMIYKDGRWIERLLGTSSASLAYKAFRDWAFIDSLHEVSNSNATGNTFKFLNSELTHTPWFLMPGTCKISPEPIKKLRADGINVGQIGTEACALQGLAKWFNWMRQEGIFDNTTIIVVSDHSSGTLPEMQQAFGDRHVIGRPSALLLVKHRVADPKAPLKVSDQKVGIVHTMEMAFSDINLKPYNKDYAERLTFFRSGITSNEYIVGGLWRVKGSIYDPDSWQDVTNKE